MILTEEEARKKWCCNGRNCEAVNINSMETQYDHPDCQASKCMAWRWTDPETFTEYEPVNPDDPMSAVYPKADIDRRGYCGLAGRP